MRSTQARARPCLYPQVRRTIERPEQPTSYSTLHAYMGMPFVKPAVLTDRCEPLNGPTLNLDQSLQASAQKP